MATLKNAFVRQKQAITAGISPIDTTLPIKKGGVPFRLGFFQQTVFQAAGEPPLTTLAPSWLYRKINIAALFSARKACTDTALAVVCVGCTHTRKRWVANIFFRSH